MSVGRPNSTKRHSPGNLLQFTTGPRWAQVDRWTSGRKNAPKDIHRGVCGNLPPAPGGHRSTGGHRAGKMHRKTFTGGFVEICHRPPVIIGRPVSIGPEFSEQCIGSGGSGQPSIPGGSGGSTGCSKIFLQFLKGCQFRPTQASSDSPAFGYYWQPLKNCNALGIIVADVWLAKFVTNHRNSRIAMVCHGFCNPHTANRNG